MLSRLVISFCWQNYMSILDVHGGESRVNSKTAANMESVANIPTAIGARAAAKVFIKVRKSLPKAVLC